MVQPQDPELQPRSPQDFRPIDRSTIPNHLRVYSRRDETVSLHDAAANTIHHALILADSGNALLLSRTEWTIPAKARARLYDLGAIAMGKLDGFLDISPEPPEEIIPDIVIGKKWNMPLASEPIRAVIMRKTGALPQTIDELVQDPLAHAAALARAHQPHLNRFRRAHLQEEAQYVLQDLQKY